MEKQWLIYTLEESVTSQSREFPVPGISLLFGWYRYRKKLVPEKEPFPVPENVLWCTFFEKVHIWNTLLDGQSSRQSNDPQFLKHIRVGELWLKRATESSGCCGCGGSWITEPFYQQPHSQSLATKQPGTSKVTASSLPNWLQIWGSNKQRVSTFVLESQIADCQAESFVSNWNWKKVQKFPSSAPSQAPLCIVVAFDIGVIACHGHSLIHLLWFHKKGQVINIFVEYIREASIKGIWQLR